jgi:putative SOS response-associated peptidase YedK
MVDGERQFDFMRWQLVPRWEPEFKTKLTTINAKSETVFESRLFRNIVVRQRCIVPLSGFYEWKKEDGAKRPYRIHLQDNSIMNVAGIWDTWRSGTPEARHSFSILTTSANKFMSEIHERMPVILSKEQIDDWLSLEVHEPETLKQMLQPCSNDWLACAVVTEKL